MISVKISGGLGNQLFQYAFGRSLSTRNNTHLVLDISNYTHDNGRPYRLDAFSVSVATISPGLLKKIIAKIIATFDTSKPLEKKKYVFEWATTFCPEILSLKKGHFTGNWQSEKYFSSIQADLRKELTLKNWSKTGKEFKDKIEAAQGVTPVSIHIRRGDIAHNPHLIQKHGVMDTAYYTRAIEKIKETVPNPVFYIFSDDVSWVGENMSQFKTQILVSGTGVSDVEELMLMSLCSHNIIANSTFSWWGAWLNTHKNKIVIAPNAWFKAPIDTTDLIPDSWIRI